MYAISSEDAPVYSEENILTRFPGWTREMEGLSAEERNKKCTYIIKLIQVETENLASTVR